MKKKIIGLASACLISFLMGATLIYLVYGQTASTFWITEGVYPQGEYTVWREGSYYFAKDIYGQIQYSGTNASTIINSAIDASNDVSLQPATYQLTGQILLKNHVTLRGIGSLPTNVQAGEFIAPVTLQWASADTTKAMIINGEATYVRAVHVKNLLLDGNDTAPYGFRLIGVRDSVFEDVGVKNLAQAGYRVAFRLEGDATRGNTVGNEFRRITAQNVQIGISLEGDGTGFVTDNHFDAVVIRRYYQKGIDFVQYADTNLFGWVFLATNINNTNGIHLNSGTPTSDVGINDEMFEKLILDFDGVGGYGIRVNYCQRSVLVSAHFGGVNYTQKIYYYPSASVTELHVVWGYDWITEASGNNTITASTSVLFNHGLSGIPTHVSLGFQTIGYGAWRWNATSTQIGITVTNSGTYNFTWYARYEE